MNNKLHRADLRFPRVLDLRHALIGCASQAEGLRTHYEWAAQQRPLIDHAVGLLERAGARYIPAFENSTQHRILGLPVEDRPEWWGRYRALIEGGQDAAAADAWAVLDGAARYWRLTLDALDEANSAADAAAGELDSTVAGALDAESVKVRASLLELRRAMHAASVNADPDYTLRRAGEYAERLRSSLDGLGAWIVRLGPAAEQRGGADRLRLSAMKDKADREPKATRRERRAKWLAEAMLTVRDHPEWSDATIAERVGINKSRLSRSPEYRAAASMARTPKTPAGSVTVANGDRELEAEDDSFDPSRRASRQWQNEEDIDDRIDRETKETQRKTQRGGVKTPVNRRSGGA